MRKQIATILLMQSRLILVLALGVFSCCSKEQTPTPLIMRPARDKLALAKVKEIHLQADSSRVIGTITSMQVAENGDLYLNDESSSTVHVYSTDGHFVRRLGRFGQGPGEFQHNRVVRLTPEMVAVDDVGAHKLVFFDFHGKYLKDQWFSSGDFAMAGQFDISPDGARIYAGGFEVKIKAGDICRKSAVIAMFDENSKPVALGGRMDPIVESYCNRFAKASVVRIDAAGNIYLIPERLPRITKYNAEFEKIGSLNYYTDAWKHPYENDAYLRNTIAEMEEVTHSAVIDGEVGKKTGKVFVCHAWEDVERSRREKQRVIHSYLSVISADDQLVLASEEVPLSPMTIDKDEDIYFIEQYTSTGCIIGKYELTPLAAN